jgi:hypothetical protein
MVHNKEGIVKTHKETFEETRRLIADNIFNRHGSFVGAVV